MFGDGTHYIVGDASRDCAVNECWIDQEWVKGSDAILYCVIVSHWTFIEFG